MSPERIPFTTRDGRQGLVRAAAPRDARAAIAMVRAVVAERPRTLLTTEEDVWRPREWRRRRLGWEARGVTLVAEVEGAVAGVLGCVRKDGRATRHVAEFGILVSPAFRSAGVGTALLRGVERWARDVGVTRMQLGVFTTNERARDLYLRLGYVEEGLERGAARYPDGDVDIVLMAKHLDDVPS